MSDDNHNSSLLKKLLDVISIDPQDVIRDAVAAGLAVSTIPDFRNQTHNYWRIEDLCTRYANSAARWAAASGVSSGVGGIGTMVVLGSGDLGHVAARLYRAAQQMGVANGFDPNDPMEHERIMEVFMFGMGLDSLAQAAIKQQVAAAAKIAGKRGANSNWMLKMIMWIAATVFKKQINSRVAAAFLPILGGAIGGASNYALTATISRKMQARYRDEYFRTWQANAR
jgi:hypothetical protein